MTKTCLMIGTGQNNQILIFFSIDSDPTWIHHLKYSDTEHQMDYPNRGILKVGLYLTYTCFIPTTCLLVCIGSRALLFVLLYVPGSHYYSTHKALKFCPSHCQWISEEGLESKLRRDLRASLFRPVHLIV